MFYLNPQKVVRIITMVTSKQVCCCAEGEHSVTGEAGEVGDAGEGVEVVQVGFTPEIT